MRDFEEILADLATGAATVFCIFGMAVILTGIVTGLYMAGGLWTLGIIFGITMTWGLGYLIREYS